MIPIPQHIKGLIYDLDGTLADTMSVHYKATQIACTKFDIEFPYEYFLAKAGIPTLTVFEMFVKEYNHKGIDGIALGKDKESIFLELIPTVKAIRSAEILLLDNLGKRKIAVGSGGQRISVDKTLHAIGHYDKIDTIVTADDVIHHKPHPQTFLDCAKNLGLSPNECIVLEDAELGFEAAQRAGMEYININDYL